MTKGQKAIKNDLTALYKQTRGLYAQCLEDAEKGVIEPSKVDCLSKMLSSFRMLRESAYAINDIPTWREEKEIALKERALDLQKQAFEVNTELKLLEVE